MDQLRHSYYLKHVYFKFLKEIRLRFDNIPLSGEIPDDCRSVGWMDGDWPQLKAVTSEEITKLSDVYRHTDCKKHAAAALLVQQPCNVGMIFKSQHSLQAQTTEKDECSILARNINAILASHPGLCLSHHKRRALADGISCQPKNHQKVCTPDNTRASFIGPGLLDEGSKSAPDMLVILKTRCKTLLQEELELVRENFVELYNIMMRDGQVPDELLSQMGFPSDRDMNNREVERNAQISQVTYQRAKILLHAMQRQYREQRLHDLHQEKISKINVENHDKRQKILEINQQCEEKLFKVLGADNSASNHPTNATTLTRATLQDFSTHCKANELNAFCRARILPNESNTIIPKKKGKFVEALNGDKNLISFAHRIRNRPPHLKLTETPLLETLLTTPEPVVCRFSLPTQDLDPTINCELSFLMNEWVAAAL
jgi:hypothetical protein